jgi:hypothetical protein
MPQGFSAAEKGRLFGKIVYIYQCFYAMAAAEKLSVSLVYGAALFISLSALIRVSGFTLRTSYDPRWLKGLKLALVVFFLLSALFASILYPLLYAHANMATVIGFVMLPLAERLIENAWLRRHPPSDKESLIKTLLFVRLCVFTGALALVLAVDESVLLPAVVLGMVLSFFRQYIFADYASEYPKTASTSADIREMRSVRLYDGMVITSGAALNIFAFTYVLFSMLRRPGGFFLNFFVAFAILAFAFTAVYIGTHRFYHASLVQKIGQNAVFVLGTFIALFAVYIFRDSWVKSGLAFSVQTALLLIGLILQMSGTLGMKEDMRLVVRLFAPGIKDEDFAGRAERLDLWSVLISEAVFIAVLLALLAEPVIYNLDFEGYITLAPQVGAGVAIFPTLLLLMSLFLSLRQPLTKKYGKRLELYAQLRREGHRNAEMEKRLASVLVKKYKKRIGVHIIRAFLKPVMYHTVTGKEHVTALPGVFVFNHGELYGPVAAVVFLPYDMRPWILHNMIEKEAVTQHMYDGTFGRIKWLPVFMRRFLARILSRPVVWALSSFDPIPVYRGTAREVIRTFSLSVECLCAGDSILLFPENPKERYSEAPVSDFYRGFAHIGRLYHKKTDECVMFYPVYASKKGRELRIGKGVQYNPGSRREEDRIVEELQQRMRELQQLDGE